MAKYRDRTTGELKTQGELRRDNPNMSLPKVWNENVLDALGVDPVLSSSKPSVGPYQRVESNGVEQLANGNWVYAWQAVDMFSDDEDGTKAEKEAAYQAETDSVWADKMRKDRSDLLKDTDWWATSDRTMTAEQTAYRQALRDISSHANWPYLEEADWPTKP